MEARGQYGRNQASSVVHTRGERFSAERGFLAELGPLAASLHMCRHVRRTFCCQPSVESTALESRQRRCGRTEFCGFLVCPEFLLKRRLLFLWYRSDVLHLGKQLKRRRSILPPDAHHHCCGCVVAVGRDDRSQGDFSRVS